MNQFYCPICGIFFRYTKDAIPSCSYCGSRLINGFEPDAAGSQSLIKRLKCQQKGKENDNSRALDSCNESPNDIDVLASNSLGALQGIKEK